MPEWARFFISVGAALGTGADPNTRMVVAIVAPTRAYAAAFVALGAVTSRAAQPGEMDSAEHLRRLCSLNPGTPMFYVESDKKRKAVFLGCVPLPSGEAHLKLQFERRPGPRESGGLIQWLPLSYAHRIRVANEASTDLPKKQKAAPIIGNAAFVRHVLNISDVSEFALNARSDCLIVGAINTLRAETTGTQFSAGERGAADTQGTLNDVLRVRQFLAEREPHHSEVFKRLAEVPPASTAGDRAHAVVFDGSAAFLRLRSHFQHSHRIVVLERTDPHLEEAAEAFKAGYIEDRLPESRGSQWDGLAQRPPSGVEISAYWVKRQ
jgi:hypothetical protein